MIAKTRFSHAIVAFVVLMIPGTRPSAQERELDSASASSARRAEDSSQTPDEELVTELIRRLSSPDADTRLRVIRAVRRFATDQFTSLAFEPLRPRLVAALAPFVNSTDRDERAWSVWSLGLLVPDSLPTLLSALAHDDAEVRASAAEQIEKSMWRWFPAREGQPVPHPRTRSIEIVIARGLDALRKALADPVDDVQVFAAMSLWKLGPSAAAAEHDLAIAETDDSPTVRFWARQARRRTQESRRSLVLRIAAHRSNDSARSSEPTKTVETLEVDLDAPAVHEELRGGEWKPTQSDALTPKRRWLAADALIRDHLPELLEREASTDETVASHARDVLVRIEQNAQERIDDLVQELNGEEEHGGPAGWELVQLGPAVTPTLVDDFFFPWYETGPPVYAAHVWVLSQLDEDGIAALAIGLEHTFSYANEWCAEHLIRTGPPAHPTVPAILSIWRNEPRKFDVPFWDERTPDGFTLAMQGVIPIPTLARAWNLASLGDDALPAFVAALDDRHALVRTRAARVLEGMGASAAPALDALSRRFDDSEPAVRDAAARAVIVIAPEGSELARRAAEIVGSQTPK